VILQVIDFASDFALGTLESSQHPKPLKIGKRSDIQVLVAGILMSGHTAPNFGKVRRFNRAFVGKLAAANHQDAIG
jgi:hypothetical protein